MYCKAGVQCTNPEIYGDIKRGRRLAPSKGIVCPRCQGKCCNEACLEKHKCKQRARPSSSVQGMRAVQHARWQGLDPSMGFDPTGGLLDPNMALALARAGQGGLLLPQGGNMMPTMIPILPLPLMFNAAALQQAGADGNLDAAQLQAALAAMGGGGMSAPMMLAPMGGPGTPTADAAAAGMHQALQLAQLQQLQAAGLGGPLLQLTVQPDGSTGLVQTGANGQRMALPQGLMQGMPLQLPQGLQLLSAEQLQLAGGDGSNGMPLMQIMADGSTAQMDQATMNAVAAAAAAGGLDSSLMAGLTAMGANLGALAGVSARDAQAFLEQQQQQLELNAAAAAAVAAAAAEGMPDGMGDAGVEPHVSTEAAAAAAGMPGGLLGPGEGEGGLADPHAAADMAAAAQHNAELLAQQQADVAEAGGLNLGDQPGGGEGLPPGAVIAGSEGLMLPAIAPLHMQGVTPALLAALQAASGARAGYNAEEDTAAAALMSLATDKQNKASAAEAAALAAKEAANAGIIARALADQAMEEARMLRAEADAEEAAAAAQQQQQQQQQQQAGASAGGGGGEGIKLEQYAVTDEQLQQLQLHLMQQQQMAMLQDHHNQQQALAQQVAEQQQQQQQQEANFEQQQHLQQHLEAQAQQEFAQQHQYEQQ